MKITKDGLLPLDPDHKNCIVRGGCSLVGEERGDENVPLHTMHTLWLREHNRIARGLKRLNSHWSGTKIFDETRKIVGGIWQHIVYNEYVPVLTKLPTYNGYNPQINPSVTNAFATAAFRYGHSLIPNEFDRLNNNFDVIKKPLSLQDAFNNRIPVDQDGIESVMFGLVGNESSAVDTKFAEGIARKLFVLPGKTGHMDLLALNMQRGRDHGLPTYGKYRSLCGLRRIRSWRHLNRVMQPGAARIFRRLYKRPSDIDLFAAGIAERHATYRDPRGNRRELEVGPTFTCLFQQQFKAMRDGDRYFYENSGVFSQQQLQAIKKVTLSTVLCNNLKGIVSIQPSAFHVGDAMNNRRISCSRIPTLDLAPWSEHRVVVGDGQLVEEDQDLDNIINSVDEGKNNEKFFDDVVENNEIDDERFEDLGEDENVENEFEDLNKFYLENSQNDEDDIDEEDDLLENI